MKIIARFDNVSYLYPRSTSPVLRDVSLDVRRGEFLGIIGPTGAGKTTLCLALNGIVPQFFDGRFFGHVTVAGMDTLERPVSALARHVGMVFEDPETQITATSVENEVAFALENLKVPREDMMARIPRVLEAVRLEGAAKKHPYELSGGQKQRLAIAAALAVQPDLLVLDEPTSQLDPVGAQEVFATVRELNATLGITVVMVSHAAEEMAAHADRIALLSHGTLAATGTPDDIYGDVARLEAHGLRPPQVAQTFYLIEKFGGDVGYVPTRLEDGVRQLAMVRRWDARFPADETPAIQGELLLSVRNLVYRYDDGTQALRGVSLDVHAGEYVLIAGQNGAGKSTLVKHFLKLLEPTQGDVVVYGTDTREWAMSDLARRIGYVAQNPDNQIFNATVWDEVTFALRNLGYGRKDVEAHATESLASMGLLDVRDRHPLSLPKGSRARVVIAAILAMQPEIVIFDEPTTGQDYRGAKAILDVSRDLHREGKTVIVITHHLYLMPAYAERAIVMGEGTILRDAPVREAFHEVELLRSTYLMPPQAVLLAQALDDHPARLLVTPEEVAAYVTGHESEASTCAR